MANAINDLEAIIQSFEKMEGYMQRNVAIAVKRRGLTEAADILADVAHIREAMLNLIAKLKPK